MGNLKKHCAKGKGQRAEAVESRFFCGEMPSLKQASRLRGRSRYGEAKSRLTYVFLFLPDKLSSSAAGRTTPRQRRRYALCSMPNTLGAPLKQSAFTLVEMLVVLIVISILIVIALPAFEKIAKGSGVELAASNIAGKLKQARSYAITNRECVAVLFPQTGVKDKYMYAGYRTCIVYYDSSVYKFRRWISGEKWEFLPTGTAVLELDQDMGCEAAADTYTDNEKVDNVSCSDIGAGTLSDVVAVIFKPTGKIPDNTRYVTLGEAVYSGGALVHTTRDAATGVTYNQIDITVDQYTGRVSYGRD